jgi:hypothetical protein
MITVLTLGFSFYPLHCVRPKRESPLLLNHLAEATPEDREDELMMFCKKRGITVERVENLRSEKEGGYPGVRNR